MFSGLTKTLAAALPSWIILGAMGAVYFGGDRTGSLRWFAVKSIAPELCYLLVMTGVLCNVIFLRGIWRASFLACVLWIVSMSAVTALMITTNKKSLQQWRKSRPGLQMQIQRAVSPGRG